LSGVVLTAGETMAWARKLGQDELRAALEAEGAGLRWMTWPCVAKVRPPYADQADLLDDVGAGDAVAAGFAFRLLRGWPPERCARAGHTIAVHALRGPGDWETLPHLDDVAEELGVQS
jgi:sugar/nucleoside kinase (ribokinase family)